MKKDKSPPGGLEPPNFQLTAERASRLRHGGLVAWQLFRLLLKFEAYFAPTYEGKLRAEY